MNTKKYISTFLTGILFVFVLTTPMLAQTSEEEDIPPVEIQSVEEAPQVEPQQNIEEQTTEQTEEISPSEGTKEGESITEEKEIPKEVISTPQKAPVVTKVNLTYEPKTRKSLFKIFLDKADKFCQKVALISFDKKQIMKKLSNLPVFDKFITYDDRQKQVFYPQAVVPYYLINSYISLENYKKSYFSDYISDVLEMMPYNLAILNTEVKVDAPKNTVTPQGTTDVWVLANAPSPLITVGEKHHIAKLVIDIANNTLYKYDKDGFPQKAYLVATGARGTRTMPGLRVVTYKERFPYSGAPDSKRALDPYSYGPYILFLNAVEPRTGRQYCVEQLLHGNGNEYSIGRKVSHGCVRTNNRVMDKELSKEVKRGDYILLINPDKDYRI